ncbi:MAG TPA: hypothetical protein VH437_24160 [Terriglobales bacterium]|jgi:hypothetical protein
MLASEFVLGVGILGGLGFFIALICVIIYFLDKPPSRNLLRVALVFGALGAASQSWSVFNWHVAQNRAAPVIKACEEFRRSNGVYPRSLDQLVPEFLPSLPRPSYTWMGRRYGYASEPPRLYFAAMFHGVVTYDFESHHWWTND